MPPRPDHAWPFNYPPTEPQLRAAFATLNYLHDHYTFEQAMADSAIAICVRNTAESMWQSPGDLFAGDA